MDLFHFDHGVRYTSPLKANRSELLTPDPSSRSLFRTQPSAPLPPKLAWQSHDDDSRTQPKQMSLTSSSTSATLDRGDYISSSVSMSRKHILDYLNGDPSITGTQRHKITADPPSDLASWFLTENSSYDQFVAMMNTNKPCANHQPDQPDQPDQPKPAKIVHSPNKDFASLVNQQPSHPLVDLEVDGNGQDWRFVGTEEIGTFSEDRSPLEVARSASTGPPSVVAFAQQKPANVLDEWDITNQHGYGAVASEMVRGSGAVSPGSAAEPFSPAKIEAPSNSSGAQRNDPVQDVGSSALPKTQNLLLEDDLQENRQPQQQQQWKPFRSSLLSSPRSETSSQSASVHSTPNKTDNLSTPPSTSRNNVALHSVERKTVHSPVSSKIVGSRFASSHTFSPGSPRPGLSRAAQKRLKMVSLARFNVRLKAAKVLQRWVRSWSFQHKLQDRAGTRCVAPSRPSDRPSPSKRHVTSKPLKPPVRLPTAVGLQQQAQPEQQKQTTQSPFSSSQPRSVLAEQRLHQEAVSVISRLTAGQKQRCCALLKGFIVRNIFHSKRARTMVSQMADFKIMLEGVEPDSGDQFLRRLAVQYSTLKAEFYSLFAFDFGSSRATTRTVRLVFPAVPPNKSPFSRKTKGFPGNAAYPNHGDGSNGNSSSNSKRVKSKPTPLKRTSQSVPLHNTFKSSVVQPPKWTSPAVKKPSQSARVTKSAKTLSTARGLSKSSSSSIDVVVSKPAMPAAAPPAASVAYDDDRPITGSGAARNSKPTGSSSSSSSAGAGATSKPRNSSTPAKPFLKRTSVSVKKQKVDWSKVQSRTLCHLEPEYRPKTAPLSATSTSTSTSSTSSTSVKRTPAKTYPPQSLSSTSNFNSSTANSRGRSRTSTPSNKRSSSGSRSKRASSRSRSRSTSRTRDSSLQGRDQADGPQVEERVERERPSLYTATKSSAAKQSEKSDKASVKRSKEADISKPIRKGEKGSRNSSSKSSSSSSRKRSHRNSSYSSNGQVSDARIAEIVDKLGGTDSNSSSPRKSNSRLQTLRERGAAIRQRTEIELDGDAKLNQEIAAIEADLKAMHTSQRSRYEERVQVDQQQAAALAFLQKQRITEIIESRPSPLRSPSHYKAAIPPLDFAALTAGSHDLFNLQGPVSTGRQLFYEHVGAPEFSHISATKYDYAINESPTAYSAAHTAEANLVQVPVTPFSTAFSSQFEELQDSIQETNQEMVQAQQKDNHAELSQEPAKSILASADTGGEETLAELSSMLSQLQGEIQDSLQDELKRLQKV